METISRLLFRHSWCQKLFLWYAKRYATCEEISAATMKNVRQNLIWAAVYNDICDQMEEKENGTYLFLSKKDNGVVFEYKVDILDESFNLSYVHITANNDTFHIDFDN